MDKGNPFPLKKIHVEYIAVMIPKGGLSNGFEEQSIGGRVNNLVFLFYLPSRNY